MPSDPRTQAALKSVAEQAARFRIAVENARDQMRAYLTSHLADSSERTDSIMRELGAFASGRIDTSRFSTVFAQSGDVAPDTIARVERCAAVLDDLIAHEENLFVVKVPSAGDSAMAVSAAFANAGRAFGAVLGFQAAKTGSYKPEVHDRLLDLFSFDRWNRSERLMSPPLVIEVDGADFSDDQLARFMDGTTHIVVVIRGPSSPAPLARLITPGVFVGQSFSADSLTAFAGFDGPAVAALVPAGAATFEHDPRGGAAIHDRLRIDFMPDPPARAVGSRSVWQQRDELSQLALLARMAENETTEVDTLANWLLQASGLEAAQPGGMQK